MKTKENELTFEQMDRMIKSKEQQVPNWASVLLYILAFVVAGIALIVLRFLR